MGSSMVRYKVQPDRADENETLVKAVYEQLARERPEGLHYATFKLPDGVSFMHVVFETDQPGRILGEVARSRHSPPRSRLAARSHRSPRS